MQLAIDNLLGEGSLKAFERQIIIVRNDVVGIMWKDLKLVQGFVRVWSASCCSEKN